jgi:transcriptional regulator with XRE-family HTH domain
MNALIEFVEFLRKDGKSIRQMAKELGVSHAHLAKVIRGEVPISWSFAAKVAEKTNLEPMKAFEMAGLWPTGRGGSDERL